MLLTAGIGGLFTTVFNVKNGIIEGRNRTVCCKSIFKGTVHSAQQGLTQLLFVNEFHNVDIYPDMLKSYDTKATH